MWRNANLNQRWLLVNVATTAVLMAWLPSQRGDILTVNWTMAAALGFGWGLAQWLVLRQSGLSVSALWPAANVVGWVLGTPLLLYATDGLSPSLQVITQLPRTYNAMFGLPFPLGVGMFILLTLLAFFGIWAGVPLAGGQWLLLWLRRETRPFAQQWLGQSAWGWAIGIFGGGLLVSLIVVLVTAIPGVTAVPLWLVFGLTGAITGVIYTIFTNKLVQGQFDDFDDDPLGLEEFRIPPHDD